MTSLPRIFCLLAAIAAFASVASVSFAQDATLAPPAKQRAKSTKAAAQPAATSDRRPGELEGWTSGSSSVTTAKTKKLPPGAVSAKELPDGGIPLPAEKTDSFAPPIGIDSNGRPGGMFRF